MPVAEGGSSEGNADFRFDEEESDFETRPTGKLERAEQQFPEGEDPVVHFQQLADKEGERVAIAEKDIRRYGKANMKGNESLAQYQERVRGQIQSRERDITSASAERSRFDTMTQAIKEGNGPEALDRAHGLLLQESVQQDLVVEELATEVQGLYKLAEEAGARLGEDDQNRKGEKATYLRDDNPKHTMFQYDPTEKGGLERYQLEEAGKRLDAAQDESTRLENMAKHVKSIRDGLVGRSVH